MNHRDGKFEWYKMDSWSEANLRFQADSLRLAGLHDAADIVDAAGYSLQVLEAADPQQDRGKIIKTLRAIRKQAVALRAVGLDGPARAMNEAVHWLDVAFDLFCEGLEGAVWREDEWLVALTEEGDATVWLDEGTLDQLKGDVACEK